MRVVAVTGASGYVGQKVVQKLAAAPQIERILALDLRPAPFASDKVTFIPHDVARPMTALFEEHGVDAAAPFAFAAFARPGGSARTGRPPRKTQ